MKFIRNFFQRRKLRPVVKELPHKLKEQFGGGDYYTAGQVETSAALLNIKTRLMPAAFAVACTPEEFRTAEPDLSTTDYQAIRSEIARLFILDEWHINCRTLIARFKSPASARGNPPPVRHDGGGHR